MTISSSPQILLSQLKWSLFLFKIVDLDSSGISPAELQQYFESRFRDVPRSVPLSELMMTVTLILSLALLFKFGSQNGVLVLSAPSRVIEKILKCQDVRLLGVYGIRGEAGSSVYTSTENLIKWTCPCFGMRDPDRADKIDGVFMNPGISCIPSTFSRQELLAKE